VTALESDGRAGKAFGAARRWGLLLEALIFTVVVPGSVTLWLPRDVFGLMGPLPPLGRAWLIASAPLTLGLLVYARCVWEFALRGRGIPAPLDHPKRLVVTGLYRYVRNPMYVGVLLVLLGEALLFQSWSLLWYLVGFFLVIHATVLVYEEPNLRSKFGDSYAAYSAAVARWLPGKPYRAS
jgi:protein-S-isoprenylcysteine O-methyltransferase Ste14